MDKFLIAAIAIVLGWYVFSGRDNSPTTPPPDFAAAHGGKVIMYGTDWCGYCAKARTLLTDNHIDYYEYDIEKSEEGKRQYDQLGGKGILVLLINHTVVKGYDPDYIVELASAH